MNERLLQFIWQYLYFNKEHLTTITGDPVSILTQGLLNSNQGPDFLHARIQINNIMWFGNIELHVKTSDWNKHGHAGDEHYGNIILHVVWEHDQTAEQTIPVLELKSRISASLLQHYHQLMETNRFIPCQNQLRNVSELVWMSWKERMIAERFAQKNEKISQLLQNTNHHWEETFWQLLAGNFGNTLNTDAFESIAGTLPVTLLAKYKNQVQQLEALLLGQAGLLNDEFTEDYPVLLQKEYKFLQKKHQLKPVKQLLHFLRMRPSNFPSLRLAQLAMLIHQSSHLFARVIEADDLETIRQLLAVTANDYWHYHYRLNEPADFKKKQLGRMMINNILINTIIPVLFVYGEHHANEKLKQKATHWLQQLPKEKNSITKQWETAGAAHTSAFDSQALLYLKKKYCSVRLCLTCAIGNSILKKQVTS